ALHVGFGGDTDDKALRRVFTLRQFDPARARLAFDLVLHGQGLACQWAEQARPGDTLAMAGPRSGYAWPPGAAWLLAVVDESALPALATIVEHTPATHPIHAVLALRQATEIAYLEALQPRHPNLRITPLPPTPDLARWLPSWPDGPGAAFIAGESQWVARVREHLQALPGVAWAHIHASGYWSEGQHAYLHAPAAAPASP
ncbi:MAG: siderophore-interacting protein, partial [Comamonas sp.]